MGIGIGIFFLAVGAILSFAVGDSISGINLVLVGYILMGAGALALILGIIQNAQRTRSHHTEDVRVVEEERRREVP
jgi:hypothetical protein